MAFNLMKNKKNHELKKVRQNQNLLRKPLLNIKSCIGNTVRLRFRKSISGHHFQTIRKLANNDFQYHRGFIHSI